MRQKCGLKRYMSIVNDIKRRWTYKYTLRMNEKKPNSIVKISTTQKKIGEPKSFNQCSKRFFVDKILSKINKGNQLAVDKVTHIGKQIQNAHTHALRMLRQK